MKKLATIGFTIVCIWLMYEFPHAMINPGELVDGHKELNDKCASCHMPFLGAETNKCIECHKLSEIGKVPATPSELKSDKEKVYFHEYLEGQECTACHSDHNGSDPDSQVKRFDHGLLTAAVIDKCSNCHNIRTDDLHKQVISDCKNCHNTNGWKREVTFKHEYIIESAKNNCVSCHENPEDDFHVNFGENCSQCHNTTKWVPSTFEHSSYFILDKDHNTTCITCHTVRDFKSYTCYGCHEHTQSNIMSKHLEEGITDLNNCVSCHRSANESENDGNENPGEKTNENESNKSGNKNERNGEDNNEEDE